MLEVLVEGLEDGCGGDSVDENGPSVSPGTLFEDVACFGDSPSRCNFCRNEVREAGGSSANEVERGSAFPLIKFSRRLD